MPKSIWPACPASLVVFVPFLIGLFLYIPAGGALARESTRDDRLTILITASRFAETVDETLAPVTVITRREIEEKQAGTVEEVLRSVPGITLTNSGGVGKQTSLFLRGTESKHVLVLIDGVKTGSATSGTAPFQHLPLDQIERIEVVRGPRSSLYGSEAIGGVIQIFTRKGRGEPRSRFSVSIGSHNTRKTGLGVSGGDKDAWYNFGLSGLETHGFDACRAVAGCFTDEPDDDGYQNKAISVRGGVSLTDSLDIEGNFLNSDSETEFDGPFLNESETVTRLVSVKASLQTNEQWQSSLLAGQSKDQSDNFKDGTPASTFDTTRDQIDWQNNFRLSESNQIIAGVDYFEDKVDSTAIYAVDSRDNTGVFALLRTKINANDFELSLRNDDNEQFGDHNTGGIAWGRDFADGKRMTLSYGTAFSAPTFNDLYYPEFISCKYSAINSNNPALQPERSRSFNLGFLQAGLDGRLALNLFRTKIEDLIQYTFNVETRKVKCGDMSQLPVNKTLPVNKSININEAEITGIEISGGTQAGQWDLSASATFQNPENAGGGANDSNILARRPRRIMTFDMARQFGRYRFGAGLYARGAAYVDSANTRTTSGFALLNLRGEVKLHKNWLFLLKINNVTDKEHETVEYYPQDDLNVLATLRYLP